MICPLMQKEQLKDMPGKVEITYAECQQSRCALWDDMQARCFIAAIAINLECLRSTINIVGHGGS